MQFTHKEDSIEVFSRTQIFILANYLISTPFIFMLSFLKQTEAQHVNFQMKNVINRSRYI